MRLYHRYYTLSFFGTLCLIFLLALYFSNNGNSQPKQPTAEMLFESKKPLLDVKETSPEIDEMAKREDFETGFKMAKKLLSSEYQRLKRDPEFKPDSISSVKRIMLITSWRSGSSFLGSILGAYPGAFYVYEPLHFIGAFKYVQRGSQQKEMIAFLRNMMTCNVKNANKAFHIYSKRTLLFRFNRRYWRTCRTKNGLCFDQEYFNQICGIMPINVMKVLRLEADQVTDLIGDPDLNLKVIHLLRDPRGTLLSRSKKSWQPTLPILHNPNTFCNLLKNDLEAAKVLKRDFPEKYLQIRYEDLTVEPQKMVKMLLDFVGLPYIDEMKEYVQNHTSGNSKVGKLSKSSTSIAFNWRKSLTFKHVSDIQEGCSSVLKSLNLRIFKNEEEYKNEDISVLLPDNKEGPEK